MSIRIRHAEVQNLKALQEIYYSASAILGTLQMPFPPENAWEKRIAQVPGQAYSLVAEYDGVVRGNVGLRVEQNSPRRRHVGLIGMAVHDSFRCKGIGAALLAAALDIADNWLNLGRIELVVFVDNSPAIKLYEKFGFEVEGTLRRFAFTAGNYSDAYTMARLRGHN